MTTTTAVLGNLFVKLSQDTTWLRKFCDTLNGKDARDMIRLVRRIELGDENGVNDLSQEQVEALQYKLLKATGADHRAIDLLANSNYANKARTVIYDLDQLLTSNLYSPQTGAWVTDSDPIPGMFGAMSNASNVLPTPKEINMITITNPTLVNGTDAANMTDDQIFGIIKQAEADIKTMSEIQNKPKKLQARIDALTDSIAHLVTIVDARP
jgi:hypothetical protein